MAATLKPYCWYVYFALCADNSIYTGCTLDTVRREKEHNHPTKGAKYTRKRQPVKIVYWETAPDRMSACKREYFLKKRLKKAEKLAMIAKFAEAQNGLDV